MTVSVRPAVELGEKIAPKPVISYIGAITSLFKMWWNVYNFWTVFNLIQAVVLINLAPKLAWWLLHFSQPCMAEDYDENGKPYGLVILE
jgi:hypothetical protein